MKLVKYVKSAYGELIHKVSWMPYAEWQQTTITVTVAAVVFALLIFLIDRVVKFGIDGYFTLFS